jgi:integrase/recombinase XerD
MVQEHIDIHGYAHRLELVLARVERSSLTAKNKTVLYSYANWLRLTAIGTARIIKYLSTLRIIGESLGKDFVEATKEDLEGFMLRTMTRPGLSPWTKRDYAVTLRKFYSWLQGDGKKPPEKVSCITTTLRKKDQPRIQKSELLTEEDVTQLVDATRNPRDRAFIFMLWDTGARIGELGSMRVGDITFQDQYTLLDLRGKTGPRTILACESTRALIAWLDVHPSPDNPQAPLWCGIAGATTRKILPMSYAALRARVQLTFERTNIKKGFNPHLFRHSRATWCVENNWSSYQLCRQFGWGLDSNMPATYLSLSDKLVQDKMLESYGIKKTGSDERTPPCVRCGALIPLTKKMCSACGMPVGKSPNYSGLLARETTEQRLLVLLQAPGVQAAVKRELIERGLSAVDGAPESDRPGSAPELLPPIPQTLSATPEGVLAAVPVVVVPGRPSRFLRDRFPATEGNEREVV